MQSLNQGLLYAALMFIAGLGIPVMAALNGGLGSKLQNPALATTILFVVGGAASLCYLLLSQRGLPQLNATPVIPFYFYLGGLFVIFYILSITWVAPRFGVGNAIAFVLLGQLVSMTVIDHFSLLGSPHFPISSQRLIGLILMTAGIFLTARRI